MTLRAAGAALVATLALAAPAHAAFPGANGKIAFEGSGINVINPDGSGLATLTTGFDAQPIWSADGSKLAFERRQAGNSDIYAIKADGTGLARLTSTSQSENSPAWSPDGTKLAFTRRLPSADPRCEHSEIFAMNSDGSGEIQLTNEPAFDHDRPTWSPDGLKIAFDRGARYYDDDELCHTATTGINTMNADGSAQSSLTSGPCGDIGPDWSPAGDKIAFSSCRDYSGFGSEVYTMNPDGTDVTRITSNSMSETFISWSPDGKKMAFGTGTHTSGNLVWVMNADGTGATYLADGYSPAWQPLPAARYEHPQSASQLSVSLVPAFKQCGTGGNPSNSAHSPPLSTGSCNPPKAGSAVALFGSASQGSASFTVVAGDTDPTNGNQADVGIGVSMNGIEATGGGDYDPNPSGPDMTAVTRLRITDKANGYGGLPATATEYDFEVPVDCFPTLDPVAGAACGANTTANSLVPGLVQEQRHAIVQAFRVRVDDSGANGIRGDGDDRIFATQGVFVP